MKILLLGDASNYHHSLSIGLAKLGHEVTVASNGSRWMSTIRDIDLSRRPGKLGGLLYWMKLNTVLASDLRGYDVVQIHNPIFLDLRPHRVKAIFDKLRRDNGGVFLTALGTDTPYVEMCVDKNSPLAYNEFVVEGAPTDFVLQNTEIRNAWLRSPLSDHCKYVYDNIDGAVSALYEYHLALSRCLPEDKIAYGGIPIDTNSIKSSSIHHSDGPVRIMLACHRGREAEKGADRLGEVLKDLQKDNPERIHFDFVQNVPFAEFQACLDRAEIVVDQLYSYTPATTALMAMASGKVTVSGAEPQYYDFINEPILHPIINPDPRNLDELRNNIQKILDNPSLLTDLSLMGRDLVVKHNDVEVVAQRFTDLWERRLK